MTSRLERDAPRQPAQWLGQHVEVGDGRRTPDPAQTRWRGRRPGMGVVGTTVHQVGYHPHVGVVAGGKRSQGRTIDDDRAGQRAHPCDFAWELETAQSAVGRAAVRDEERVVQPVDEGESPAHDPALQDLGPEQGRFPVDEHGVVTRQICEQSEPTSVGADDLGPLGQRPVGLIEIPVEPLGLVGRESHIDAVSRQRRGPQLNGRALASGRAELVRDEGEDLRHALLRVGAPR
jgi:hypothetical protein